MVKYIPIGNDKIIVFFSNTLRILQIDQSVQKIIENYIENNEHTFLDEKLKEIIDEDIRYNVVNKIEKRNFIERLVINVSNTCNLCCTYCYAQGGNYGCSDEVMERDVQNKIVDFIANHEVRTIQFFGGEPLTNFEGIENIVNEIGLRQKEGIIQKTPEYSIVTNGTLLKGKCLDFFDKHKFNVTISIDGTKGIHDLNRKYRNGKGTFDDIEENIRNIEENYKNIFLKVETTYTANNKKQGYSVRETLAYIREKLNIQGVHITPVQGCHEDEEKIILQEFIDSVDDVMQSGDGQYPTLYDMINKVARKKHSEVICPALNGTLCISHVGDIYPCFMMIGNLKFKLGNIANDNDFERIDFDSFNLQNNHRSGKCKDCFINRICSGCMGENLLDTGDIYTTSDLKCEMKRLMYEKVIKNLYLLKTKKRE